MPTLLSSDADRAAYADILQLEGLYPATWDRGDIDGWADLFTEDGVFDHMPLGDHDGAVITGRAALRDFHKLVDSTWQGVHLPSLPGIEIDGDTAKGFVPFSWCGIRRASDRHTVHRRVVGYYDVTYTRTAAGWRMAYRREKGTNYWTHEDFDI